MKNPSLALVAAGFVLAANAHAAVVYTTDFDNFTPGTAINVASPSSPFTETNIGPASADSSIVIIGGTGTNYGLQQVLTGSVGNISGSTIAAMTAAGLTSTGGGFRLTATFTLDSFSSAGVANINLYGGSASDLSSGYRLAYNTTGGGTITISEQNGNAVAATSLGAITPAANAVITLSLVALYNSPTSAVITGYLYNGAGTLIGSATTTDNTVATGTTYGLRTAINGATSAETATFTSYTLESVPEPASAAMFALAAGAFGLRRKRA